MSPRATGAVLGLGTLATGLIAGVYYAFAGAVMLGLGISGDRAFVEAMQNINKQIQNPVFFLFFFGALVLPAWSLWQQRGDRAIRPWITAGLALYAIGLLTTMGINVPLNNDLAAVRLNGGNLGAARVHFEGTWNAWNLARAVLSTAATACLIRALLLHDRRASR